MTKTLLVSNYYFRIRCEAAVALINVRSIFHILTAYVDSNWFLQCAVHKLDFLGLFHLFKLFLRYCYDPEEPNQDLFRHKYVPKPNDFSDISEYFVRKVRLHSLSRYNKSFTKETIRLSYLLSRKFGLRTARPLRLYDNSSSISFVITTILLTL